MIAIGLIHGDLIAEHYEDDVAADPRVDALREKMTIQEDVRYTAEYLEADKRSIANKIQIHFSDGTSTDAIEVEYPIGHKRRREEGIPVLEKKFEANLLRIFDEPHVQSILEKCLDQKSLEALSVLEFQDMLSVDSNSF
jgi:2-methylcitrate dehydratase